MTAETDGADPDADDRPDGTDGDRDQDDPRAQDRRSQDRRETDRRSEAVDTSELRLDELTLPQRVFVAAVQNPFRGVLIALLFGFAFSFFIALWLAFPRLAAGFSLATLVIVAVIVGVVSLLR